MYLCFMDLTLNASKKLAKKFKYKMVFKKPIFYTIFFFTFIILVVNQVFFEIIILNVKIIIFMLSQNNESCNGPSCVQVH